MKIGILTLVGNNYGNRLQNYALQEYLKTLDSSISVYTFKRNYSRNVVLAKIKKVILNFLKPKDKHIKKIEMVFQAFNEKYICFAPEVIYNSKSNGYLNNKYDFFVTGSDQVWNPYYTLTSTNDFLTFAEKDKRISYAASFGVTTIPTEKKDNYILWLNGLKNLSVREVSAIELVYRTCGRKALVHVDPTLLIDKEHWLSIEKTPSWYKPGIKFILAYFLGDETEVIKNILSRVQKDNDIEIIHVFSREQNLDYIHDPAEFIWLIHHAESVYTDSFHCVVFSLVFFKPFTVFRRSGAESKTGSRIDSLLSMFNMSMNDNDYESFIDYDHNSVQFVLDKERKRSKEYLESAISLNK